MADHAPADVTNPNATNEDASFGTKQHVENKTPASASTTTALSDQAPTDVTNPIATTDDAPCGTKQHKRYSKHQDNLEAGESTVSTLCHLDS